MRKREPRVCKRFNPSEFQRQFKSLYGLDFKEVCNKLNYNYKTKSRNLIMQRINNNGYKSVEVLTKEELNMLGIDIKTKRKHNQAWIDAGYEFNQYNKY